MMRPPAPVRRWNGCRSASVALLFALVLPVLVGAAAFAADMGQLYLSRRSLQAAVDAAALAAVTRPDRAADIVRKILDADGQGDAVFVLQFGRYEEAGTEGGRRFVAGQGRQAVRIEASRLARLQLARILTSWDPTIAVGSEAAIQPVVSLSAGSRLASVQPGIVNGLLGPILGVSLSLGVADYQHLLHSKVELGALARGIAAATRGTEGASARLDDIMAQPVTLTTMLSILSKEEDRRADLVAGAILRKAAQQTARSTVRLALGDILRTDGASGRAAIDYPGSALTAQLSVLDFVNAAVRQNGIGNVAAADLSVPGILSASLALQLGEPLQTARALSVRQGRPSVDAAQVRMRARLETGGLLGALQTRLSLPIELVAGGGTAEVISIACAASPAERSVTVRVRPGVAKLAIGSWSGPLSNAGIHDVLPSAPIVSMPGLGVQAKGHLSVRESKAVEVAFTGKEIGNGTIRTVRTTTPIQSLAAGLIEETDLTITAGSLGLPLGLSAPSLLGLVSAMAKPIDDLLAAVLALAGVGIGEMDVRVDDLVCDKARIVG